MSSAVAHTICFTALLVFSIVIVQFAQNIQQKSVERAAMTCASEIALRISQDIVSLMAIAEKSNSSKLVLIKKINIPTHIANQGYVIKLTTMNGFYVVVVKLDMWSWIEAWSEIPVNSSSTNIIVMLEEGSLTYENYVIHYSSELLSGAKDPVVWLVKDGDRITVGIGVMECASQ